MKTEASIKLREERRTVQAEYNNLLNNYRELADKIRGNVAEKLAVRNKIKELTQKIKEAEL